MNEAIALLSLFLSFAFIIYSVNALLNAKFRALHATLLGIGGLSLVDIGKYYYIDSARLGWIGDELFQSTSLLILASLFLIFLTYFVVISRAGSLGFEINYDDITSTVEYTNFRFVKWIMLPAILYFSYIGVSGYYGIVFNGISKGIVFVSFVYGLSSRDRFLVVLSILCLLFGVDDTSRRAYIALFVPFAVFLIGFYRDGFGRIPLYFKFTVLVVVLSFFVFLNYLRSGHDFGYGYVKNASVANTINYIVNMRSIDTFYNTSYIIDKFNYDWDYYYGSTYYSVLVAPVPRSMWPEKPASLSAQLGLMMRFNYRGFDADLWQKANMFSLSPGFVGEAFANLGYVGVALASILAGFMAAIFDIRVMAGIDGVKSVIKMVFLSSFILIHRGDFYTAVSYQIFMFIGALVLFHTMVWRKTFVLP